MALVILSATKLAASYPNPNQSGKSAIIPRKENPEEILSETLTERVACYSEEIKRDLLIQDPTVFLTLGTLRKLEISLR